MYKSTVDPLNTRGVEERRRPQCRDLSGQAAQQVSSESATRISRDENAPLVVYRRPEGARRQRRAAEVFIVIRTRMAQQHCSNLQVDGFFGPLQAVPRLTGLTVLLSAVC